MAESISSLLTTKVSGLLELRNVLIDYLVDPLQFNDVVKGLSNRTAKWFPIALSDDPSKLYETLSVKLNKLAATSYNKLAESIKLIGAAYRVPINKRIAQLNSRVPTTISDLIDK